MIINPNYVFRDEHQPEWGDAWMCRSFGQNVIRDVVSFSKERGYFVAKMWNNANPKQLHKEDSTTLVHEYVQLDLSSGDRLTATPETKVLLVTNKYDTRIDEDGFIEVRKLRTGEKIVAATHELLSHTAPQPVTVVKAKIKKFGKAVYDWKFRTDAKAYAVNGVLVKQESLNE